MKKALLFIVLVLAVCLFWPRSKSVPDNPTRYALLIGAEEGDMKYKSSIDDPPKMAKVLRKYAGIEPANIKILTPKTKELPTYDAIVASLNDLVAKTDENDEVILLFEGHGLRREKEDYFLPVGLMGKSQARFWEDVIPHSLITSLTRKMRARTVVTIYENCRVEMGETQKAPGIPEKIPAIVVAPEAAKSNRLRVTLYGCMPHQLSYRNSSGSTGLFCESLRNSLTGSAAEDGEVTIDSALKYARVMVFSQVRTYIGVSQIPFASIEEGDLKTAKQFVLSGPFSKASEAEVKDKPLEKWQSAMVAGYDHLLNGNASASLVAFREASRLRPTYPRSWFEQAFILDALHQNQRAQQVMVEYVEHVPRNAHAYFEEGKRLHQWFYLEAAERLYRKSLTLKPKNPETLCWLGLLKFQQKHLAEAEKLQKQAMSLSPNWYSPYLYLGQIYVHRKQFDKAEISFRKAFSLDAKNWTTGFELAYFLQKSRRNYAESENIYRRCLKLEPKRVELIINLADCLFQQGKTEAAREQVRQAQKLGLQPVPAIKHLLALTDKPAS